MTEIFKQKYIFLKEHFRTREDVFSFIAHKAIELGFADNEDAVLKALYQREKEASTGMQDGIAIPAATCCTIHSLYNKHSRLADI